MTTQTDFADLIGTLEDNLQAMGVSDAEFDSTTGIMGLVARILDIEPTFALSDVSMDLTLSVPSTANINVPVTLSATLIGSYDDTQTSNVDLLTAEMRGATIEFYNGNTLIGTAITNENGIATLQYTPSAIGTHVITAIFNGTDIWENATSNTAYLEVESLTITSSSNIVSVGDTITLTATYLDSTGTGIENESIDFIDCSDDSIIGTATTDSNGQCTVSYSVKDTNPLYIKAICNNLTSDIIHLMQTYDLTSFLTDTSNYSFIHTSEQNANSRYEVTSANELRVYYRTQLQFLTEFTDKTKYTLEFDMKNTEGYDNFVTLNGYTIWNQQYSWIIVGGTRYSATPRYMSYVHVIVTRDGDTFTTNINNGQYIVTGTFENVTNILNVSKHGYSSSSSIYVKDLKITC